MKRALKILLWTVAVAAVAFAGLVAYAKYLLHQESQTTSYYFSELPVGADAYADELRDIHRTVSENYSLYKAKGINMDSLYAVFASRLQAGPLSARDYALLLQEYFAALRVGHSFVLLNGFSAGARPLYIEGRLFVDRPDGYLAEHGFKDKDEIIEMDGRPVGEWIAAHERFTAASTDAARTYATATGVFFSLTDSLRTFRLLRGADTVSVSLPLQRGACFSAADGPEPVQGRILSDSIGYLNIRTMRNGVVSCFEREYSKLKHLPHLIIDLRENEGGNSWNGREMCDYLIKADQPHCIQPSEIMHPRDDAFKGHIYLLVGPRTFSAAESFALDLRESGNVTLVGEPTAGDTGNGPQNFHSRQGLYFRFPTREPALSPKGFPLEGTGIPPHILVRQTVDDFMRGEDTVLNLVVARIGGKR